MQTQKTILMGTLFLVFATPSISGMQTLTMVAKDGLSAARGAIMSEAMQVSGGLFACLGTTFGLIDGGIYCLEEPSANPLITLPKEAIIGGLGAGAAGAIFAYYGYLLTPAGYYQIKAPLPARLTAALAPPIICLVIGSLPTIARSSSEAIGSLAATIAECFEKKEPTLAAQQNQTTQARLDERAVIEQLFAENCQLRDQAEQAHETLDRLTAENNALRARLTEQAPPPSSEASIENQN